MKRQRGELSMRKWNVLFISGDARRMGDELGWLRSFGLSFGLGFGLGLGLDWE